MPPPVLFLSHSAHISKQSLFLRYPQLFSFSPVPDLVFGRQREPEENLASGLDFVRFWTDLHARTRFGLCRGFTYSNEEFRLRTRSRYCEGVKFLFSFHAANQLPNVLNSGLWNCSVTHYAGFRHHVHCNLDKECEGGEDEGGGCPFSSEACHGDVAVGNGKCYRLHLSHAPLAPSEAQRGCQEKGGNLAVVITRQEVAAFLTLFLVAKTRQPSYVGLMLYNDQVPTIYLKLWTWVDDSVYYTTRHVPSPTCFLDYISERQVSVTHTIAAYYDLAEIFDGAASLNNAVPDISLLTSFVCEYKHIDTSLTDSSNKIHAEKEKIGGNVNITVQTSTESVILTVCPRGYVTHYFLSCDRQASCHATYFALKCPLYLRTPNVTTVHSQQLVGEVAMFVCDNTIQTLPYTLVCNFAVDCWDSSDERFCQHPQAECGGGQGYKCDSGQCIRGKLKTAEIQCSGISECYDDSDEHENCRHKNFEV
ncbi:hypothetical protein ACOMHN_000494 [Nucella lapillus]